MERRESRTKCAVRGSSRGFGNARKPFECVREQLFSPRLGLVCFHSSHGLRSGLRSHAALRLGVFPLFLGLPLLLSGRLNSKGLDQQGNKKPAVGYLFSVLSRIPPTCRTWARQLSGWRLRILGAGKYRRLGRPVCPRQVASGDGIDRSGNRRASDRGRRISRNSLSGSV